MNNTIQAHLGAFIWTVFMAFYTIVNVSALQMPVFIEKNTIVSKWQKKRL